MEIASNAHRLRTAWHVSLMMKNCQYVPNVNRIISFKMDPAQAAQNYQTASEAVATVRFRSVSCVRMGFILKVVSA